MIKQGSVASDVAVGSATGLEPQFAAAMAYLAGPLSGAIILMAERSNRFVRFHAWQAILGLGMLGAAAVACLFLAFGGLFLSPTAFIGFYWLAGITAALWLVVWARCLFAAFGGTVYKLPFVGDRAERRALNL